MNKNIAVLAGDGIGPEVMDQALRVLEKVGEKFGHKFTITTGLIGGAAYDKYESHFPDATKEICDKTDAILFGSVGGPVAESHLDKWKNCEVNAILALRKLYKFNCNFRPAKVYPQLMDICPLKDELIKDGIDVLVIRELVGDIYFGEKKRWEENGKRIASDLAVYDEDTIAAVTHSAFQAAQKRRKKLHSVDKANVLHTSKLWREVVKEIAVQYPDVDYQDILVDNCAMQIIRNPAQFDVLLCPNLFGDIISDAASVLPGSLGIAPSASINKDGFGLYEPAGGSAPDIAGKGIANPISQILSVAMMLKFSFNLLEESTAIENAVNKVLDRGFRTGDIAGKDATAIGTKEFTDQILLLI